jgi:phage protein D
VSNGPAYTPIYKIMKGGQDITSHFNDRTTEIQVVLKNAGDAATCKITVDDRDWRIDTVDVGVKIEVYLGYKEIGIAQMGLFEVNTVDYVIMPKQIEIVGNSAGFTGAIKAPKIENFQNKKLGDIVKELAGSKAESVYVDPKLADVELPFMNMNSSPLHMLHELERRFNAVGQFINGKYIFANRDEDQEGGGMNMPVLVLQPWHINKGFVRHTQRSQYDGVKVGWVDKDHIKHYEQAEDPNATKEADGTTQQDFFLSKQLGRSQDEAKAMAKSQMAQLKRAQGEAHLTLAKGNPWIRDQMRILLQRFRSEINGSYVCDTVTHTYLKEPGISTEILAKPPGDGADYEGLDESEFLKLGTDGTIIPNAAPAQMPNFDEIPKEYQSGGTTPVEVDTTPVNV